MPKLPLLWCVLMVLIPAACQAAPFFDPGEIVSDAYFSDASSMDAQAIQVFLDRHGSVLASAVPSRLGPSANGRSAAKIIFDASQSPSNRINPEVLLATLQKEQSLVTRGTAPNAVLDRAMGYGCPDGTACTPAYAGFANQVSSAAAQLARNFASANRSPYAPGKTVLISNETGAPDYPATAQAVWIANAASSALYQYTPHAYYGNKHFWEITAGWFPVSEQPYLAHATGTPTYFVASGVRHRLAGSWLYPMLPLASRTVNQLPSAQLGQLTEGPAVGVPSKASNSPDIYLVTSGRKWRFPNDAMLRDWGFSSAGVATVDPGLLAAVPSGGTVGVLQRDSVKAPVAAVISGRRLTAASLVLTGWGWQATAPVIGGPELDVLLPSNGALTVCVSHTALASYLMFGGKRHSVPASLCKPVVPVSVPNELLPPAT